MSNPNGLLNQNLCRYLDKGRHIEWHIIEGHTLNGLFDLSKLNLAWTKTLKVFEL